MSRAGWRETAVSPPVVLAESPVRFQVEAMDDLDRRLIALLREDADRPLKALAAAVGLSASSVRDRIVRLKASGVIRRVTIEVDLPGQVSAVLFVRLRKTPDPEAVAAVAAIAAVVRCYSLAGEVDLLVEIAGPGTETVNAARDAVAALPHVADVTTSLVLKKDVDRAGVAST
jgi:DNA-binding Lrp family transcriptional regulator